MKKITHISTWLLRFCKSGLGLIFLSIALLLSSGCETTKMTKETPVVTGGKVGVGTWETRAEFKDIQITNPDGETFSVDIPENMSGWDTFEGSWEVVEGALRQTSMWPNTRAVIEGNLPWSHYTLSLKARKLGGREGFLILFGMPSADSNVTSWWNLGGWGNTEQAIQAPGVREKRLKCSIEEGHWYDIKIVVAGATIEGYLDGELIQTAEGS